MIRYDDVAEACRHLDARVDEARQRNVDLHDLLRAAEQRALRICMLLDGQDPRKLSKTRKTAVELPQKIRDLMMPIQLAFVDGFMAGRATANRATTNSKKGT